MFPTAWQSYRKFHQLQPFRNFPTRFYRNENRFFRLLRLVFQKQQCCCILFSEIKKNAFRYDEEFTCKVWKVNAKLMMMLKCTGSKFPLKRISIIFPVILKIKILIQWISNKHVVIQKFLLKNRCKKKKWMFYTSK